MIPEEFPLVQVAGKENDQPTENFPRSFFTRKCCIIGLWVSGPLGLVCIVSGAALYDRAQKDTGGWIPVVMPRALKEILPLFLNLIVTALTESTGLIHSTTLRWALGNRLTFNSNLRLFTHVKGSFAFGRSSNFLNAGFLVLSYCATSLMFASLPSATVCENTQLNGLICDDGSLNPKAVYFSPGALIALGVGLMGNVGLTTWQLQSIMIPTWSSSPIDNAWAALSIGQRSRTDNRCMASVYESNHVTAPMRPKSRQRSAWYTNGEARRVLNYLWILVIGVVGWMIGIIVAVQKTASLCNEQSSADGSSYICTSFAGTSWSLLPDTGGTSSLVQINSVLGDSGYGTDTGFFLAFILILTFQSVLTMGLHCAELLVNLSRDEDIWRETYTAQGYKPRNGLLIMLRSWKSSLLLLLKPIVHWLFGLGMTFYYGWGVFMRPAQVLYLLIFIIGLALLGTFVSFTRPQGPQPAAFGHVQTLVDLIDVWREHLYWGHKGRGSDGICHAGTADTELERIIMTENYAAS